MSEIIINSSTPSNDYILKTNDLFVPPLDIYVIKSTNYTLIKAKNTKSTNAILAYGIKIDDYVFSLRYFKNDNKNRKYLIIYSYHTISSEISRHIYYMSNSEGGIWRYCTKVTNKKGDILEKGYNYITTTCINMKLQIFIFKYMNDFEFIQHVHPNIMCDNIEDIKINDAQLYDRIMNVNYKVDNHCFTLLEFFLPGCLHAIYDKSIKSLKDIKKMCLNELKLISPLDKTAIEYIMWKIANINSLLINLPNSSMPDINLGREIFIKNVYQGFHNFFTEKFKFINEPEHLISYQFEIPKIGNFNFDIYVVQANTINYKNKISYLQDFNIYYYTYIYNNKYYKSILSIVPFDVKIMKYGLDHQYVSCGSFIYKIADYISQTQITRTIDDPQSNDYIFIGNIIDWPNFGH